MKYILPFLILIILSCELSTRLTEGQWSGGLTPMNHPDITNPLVFDVKYEGTTLVSLEIQTQNPTVTRDTLFYSFNEPEEQVPLNCELAMDSVTEYSGRCTDADGKWAHFTMIAPK